MNLIIEIIKIEKNFQEKFNPNNQAKKSEVS